MTIEGENISNGFRIFKCGWIKNYEELQKGKCKVDR